MQSAIVSRIFRAVLPGRIFILSGSKAPQAPHASSRALHQHSTRQKLHSMRPEVTSSSLWCSRVAVEEDSNRISTCNIHSSTKVSGLQNLLSILCLQEFSEKLFCHWNQFYQAFKISVSKHPSEVSHNFSQNTLKWLQVC